MSENNTLPSQSEMRIRQVESTDAEAITDIYNHYVVNTDISFEADALPSQYMINKIRTRPIIHPWVVVEQDGKLWVPIETTSVAAGFTKAWQAAVTHLARNKATVNPAANAWKEFPPYPFAVTQSQPPAIAADLKARATASLQSLTTLRSTYRQGALSRLQKASSGKRAKAKDYNRLGLMHAMAQDLAAAKASFEAGLKRFPGDARLQLNLANVEFLASGSDQAALQQAVQRYSLLIEMRRQPNAAFAQGAYHASLFQFSIHFNEPVIAGRETDNS